ncbi:MAG: MMPL family transporter [Pirellulales bacterium]
MAEFVNGADAPQNAVADVLPAWVDRRALRDDIHVQYTGVVPLVYKAQHSLMDGLVWGFLSDFALIVVVMMIFCRDWSAGMVLLFPSAFPAVVVFGCFGWIHHLLTSTGSGNLFIDIGYVMAPAVALGVTVDDVVHFMLWYKNGITEGKTQKESIEMAFRGCARAMYQSWGVIGVGLSVFALSPFMPTRNFGIMMICMLTTALAGNLLMLPAMLAGPPGAIFAWGVRRKENRRRRKAGLPLIGEAPAETVVIASAAPVAEPKRVERQPAAPIVPLPNIVSIAAIETTIAPASPRPEPRSQSIPAPKSAIPVIAGPKIGGSWRAEATEDPSETHAAHETPGNDSVPEPHLRPDALRRTFKKKQPRT